MSSDLHSTKHRLIAALIDRDLPDDGLSYEQRADNAVEDARLLCRRFRVPKHLYDAAVIKILNALANVERG